MTELEVAVRERLARTAVLPDHVQPDWKDVRRRAGLAATPGVERPRRHRSGRLGRRTLLTLAVVLVSALTLTTIGLSRDDPWWFMRFALPGQKPAPGAKIIIVQRGTWNGTAWILTAYRTQIGTLCYGITRGAANGQPTGGAGGGCGPVPGTQLPRSHQRAPSVIYVAGSDGGIPNHIVGLVVASAERMTIRLGSGRTITTDTFRPPAALGIPSTRFFTTALPAVSVETKTCRNEAIADWRSAPIQLTGLDSSGRVVASWQSSITTATQAAGFRCNQQNQNPVVPPNSPAAAYKMRPVLRLTAPYGAHATLLVSPPVRLSVGKMLPSGQIQPIHPLFHCWKIVFSDGSHFGTCSQEIEPGPPSPYFTRGGYHVGRAVFVWVIATHHATEQPITKVTLQISKTQTVSTTPIDGIAVFAVPRSGLSTSGAQHRITLYDQQHRKVAAWWVYYRSCPNSSASGGEC